MLLSTLLFLSVLCTTYAIDIRKDIILQPVNDTGKEICLIFMQGADIQPEQYIPLTRAIQKQASGLFKLWVAIPEYALDMVNPLDIDKGIQRVLLRLQDQGANTETLVVAGHSLGGAMIQLWTDNNQDMVAAQVLMGAFLTRQWKSNYKFQYNVPTLTIGGELDGLARVTRMAEAYYSQLLDPYVAAQNNQLKFPVTVVEGVTHMQFASGDIPKTVFKRDLLPEISYEQAHHIIAEDFVAFIATTLLQDTTATTTLTQRLHQTEIFISPILQMLQLEGYHNFRPPCLCTDDVCTASADCTAACPFTALYSQDMMGAGLKGVRINNTDSFHDVWETQPTVHLPAIHTACTAPDQCVLNTFTITQGVYHSGEDLEIWKKHFDVPWLDTGYYPISAVELRTKMSSRQHVYYNAGVQNPDFNELDGGSVRCAEINQKSLDVATKFAGKNSLRRYHKYGQQLVMGSDLDVCPAGPCWIWNELQYSETTLNTTASARTSSSNNSSYISVNSPQFSTPLDFYLPKTAGFHYCKVLSPARALEWMYVDGLRAYYSLAAATAGSEPNKL